MNHAVEPMGVVLAPSVAGWDCHAVAAPIVWRDDSGYHMLYQGWRERSGPRLLGLAESDDGLHWRRAASEPVMVPTSGWWDEGGFEAGCLLEGAGRCDLYYTGFGPDGKCRVGLATSTDLRSWVKDPRSPLLDLGPTGAWDAAGVAFPSIHRSLPGSDAPWRMTYGGYGERSMQIGTALSCDGIAWRKHPSPTLPQRGWFRDPGGRAWDAGVEVHHMLARGDWYVMLYEGLGAQGRYALGVAFSPDAVVWARSPRNPLWPVGACAVNQQLSAVHPFLLQSDRALYFVEVLEASASAPHRICAARLRDDTLVDPCLQSRLDFRLWDAQGVEPKGLATPSLPADAYPMVVSRLVASAGGQLHLEVDATGLGEWQIVETVTVASGRSVSVRAHHLPGGVRLRYLPERQAVCSAWLSLVR